LLLQNVIDSVGRLLIVFELYHHFPEWFPQTRCKRLGFYGEGVCPEKWKLLILNPKAAVRASLWERPKTQTVERQGQ
jgi:hypothetical protein